MLSWPPWRVGPVDQRAGEGERVGPGRRAVCRDQCAAGRRARSSSSTGRRSRPAPSPARPARASRSAACGPGASTPSQRVIACACGPVSASRARRPRRRSARAAHESSTVSASRLAGVGQPVGAAVADPADARAARRPGPPATKVQDGGLRRALGRWRRATAALAAAAALRERRGDRRPTRADGRARCRAACEAASTSRAARAAARLATSESMDGGHPVADDQHRAGARLGVGGDAPSRPRCGGAGCRGRRPPPPTAPAARRSGRARSAPWCRTVSQ